MSNADTGTQAVIDSFDIGQAVIRIFARKAGAGRGAHSDFCWLQGRTINHWRATPERMTDFLAALEMAGWVKRGHPLRTAASGACCRGRARRCSRPSGRTNCR
ncbi:hypothetical protein [Acidovorax sp. RAC01]|uniref:hypothetical protein n=1 Tax=Acidovorax sp. RAC01 TaxID=1842533 RepID=UPI00083E81C0|nr:hypothetical protein [Acidovorax sp. RAC01]AOG24158.1 hypothetical protein BSY15_2209 [Acidovorax sp. RAC01]